MANSQHKQFKCIDSCAKLIFLALSTTGGTALSCAKYYRERYNEGCGEVQLYGMEGRVNKEDQSPSKSPPHGTNSVGLSTVAKARSPFKLTYAGVTGDLDDLRFEHNLSGDGLSEKVWEERLKDAMSTIPIYTHLFKPAGLFLSDYYRFPFVYRSTSADIPLSFFVSVIMNKWQTPVGYLRQSRDWKSIEFADNTCGSMSKTCPSDLTLARDNCLTMDGFRQHLKGLWKFAARFKSFRELGQCIAILINNDGIYVTKGKKFQLLQSSKPMLAHETDQITNCCHIISARLERGFFRPHGWKADNAIEF